MIGQQKALDPVAGIIVDEYSAQQRLFRLEVVRRSAIGIVGAASIDGAEIGLRHGDYVLAEESR
jgi:hypothetical protein